MSKRSTRNAVVASRWFVVTTGGDAHASAVKPAALSCRLVFAVQVVEHVRGFQHEVQVIGDQRTAILRGPSTAVVAGDS